MRSFNRLFLLGIVCCFAWQVKAQTVEEITTVVTQTTKPNNSSLVINNGKLTLEGTWTLDYSNDGSWFSQALDHTPDEGASVSGNTPITIIFPEIIDANTISNGLSVKNGNGEDIPGSWSQTQKTLTFEPFTHYKGTAVTVFINDQLVGETGQYRPVNYSWSFNINDFRFDWKFQSGYTKTVQLPISPTESQDFVVDWGDGTTEHITGSYASHTYTIGTVKDYSVQISGSINGWSFDLYPGSAEYFSRITEWGSLKLHSGGGHFNNCSNLTITAIDSPDISAVTSMNRSFYNCLALTDIPNINSWDVSNIIDMTETFYGSSLFSSDISDWNVVNVTSMKGMFEDCHSFDQNLNSWNVSNVTDMSYMFAGATIFNRNLNNWDVSSVNNMSAMFRSATNFNGDISSWNTGNVLDMSSMFSFASNFNQNISGWNVSKVTDMSSIFIAASSFNQNIDSWDVGNVGTMASMFNSASSFDKALNSWDVSKVENMSNMFSAATNFNRNLNSWDVSNVTDMSRMFRNATNFNGDISSWNVSSVTDMSYLFYHASNFNRDIGSWNVSNVSNMKYMFYFATLFNQDISGWNTGSTENMQHMFISCINFNQPIGSWDVSSVKNMWVMFSGATNFNQDLSNWDVSSVTNMRGLFGNASSFDQDLSSWDVTNVSNMTYMFWNATSFDQSLGDWDMTGPLPDMSYMLDNSGLSINNYDATLAGWSGQSLQSGAVLDALGLEYCDQTSRDILTNTYGWTITDGGLSTSCGSARSAVNLASEEETAEEEVIHGVTIYPNPASDHFTLELADFEGTWVTLSNLSGKVLTVPMELVGRSTAFDLTGITDRMLFLHIKQPDGERTLRILRQD